MKTAIASAGGFLAGVLLVAVLGGAKPVIRETTVTVTKPVTTGGTVITKTIVPDVMGQSLDVALDRVARAGFEADVDGGGFFGVIDEENWEVVSQTPPPGGYLEQGSSISLEIDRR